MAAHAAAFLAALAVFAGIDLAWIALVMRPLFARHLGALLVESPRIGAALAFYLVYAAGIVVLAVLPARGWPMAAGLGVVLGLVAYATYDLTNRATLKAWPLGVALVDIAWGAALTAIAALAGYAALQWMKR
jgi:uncharacterized membrane protein